MKNPNFAIFILTHGRANNLITLKALKRHGYTGRLYIIIDNEDKQADEYFKLYGDKVKMFDKRAISKDVDALDNFDNLKAITYARHYTWILAKELGLENFAQFDDDYTWFGHRGPETSTSIYNLDDIISHFLEFLNNTNLTTVCFSQGGDHIGGFNDEIKTKRKAMNSFFCRTDRFINFKGTLNDDVTAYVSEGALGSLFLTVWNIQLTQKPTQLNAGGMSEAYLSSGTYIKSFYSVIVSPSCIKVKLIQGKTARMHHAIDWPTAVPRILDDSYKKKL